MRLHLSCSLHCYCQDVTRIPTKAFLICYIHLYGKLWDSKQSRLRSGSFKCKTFYIRRLHCIILILNLTTVDHGYVGYDGCCQCLW